MQAGLEPVRLLHCATKGDWHETSQRLPLLTVLHVLVPPAVEFTIVLLLPTFPTFVELVTLVEVPELVTLVELEELTELVVLVALVASAKLIPPSDTML